MAVSGAMQMQSIFVRPMTGNGVNAHLTRLNMHRLPSHYVPSLRRNNAPMLQVRCMAGQESQNEIKPPPRPAPKESTKFSDVLAFSGPAPERINGRLAMVGFVAAMAVELSKGEDVFAQISNGGIPWFVGATVVLSLASLIPLFKGVSVQSKSEGVMTSDAELWNGRIAMLGLVALAFTEFVKGGALV
ncbi:early light-induced protein 1, chloroplastic-like [Malania oleifera]|uniref:early light-induced protein 1, chloroplastic-like n=1 Tax=Malania oleifera TaxID=397392 RepID=UPI0025AE0D61|nr:early light-induced protein 1, chloroplastic-like [Malania oleifera]